MSFQVGEEILLKLTLKTEDGLEYEFFEVRRIWDRYIQFCCIPLSGSNIASNTNMKKIVQTLVCCQNWLHHGSIPIDITTLMNDYKKYENLESGYFSYTLVFFILLFIYEFIFNLTFLFFL